MVSFATFQILFYFQAKIVQIKKLTDKTFEWIEFFRYYIRIVDIHFFDTIYLLYKYIIKTYQVLLVCCMSTFYTGAAILMTDRLTISSEIVRYFVMLPFLIWYYSVNSINDILANLGWNCHE
jgi:hypothetical protein